MRGGQNVRCYWFLCKKCVNGKGTKVKSRGVGETSYWAHKNIYFRNFKINFNLKITETPKKINQIPKIFMISAILQLNSPNLLVTSSAELSHPPIPPFFRIRIWSFKSITSSLFSLLLFCFQLLNQTLKWEMEIKKKVSGVRVPF